MTATGRTSSPWITSDEPCPSGDTDCTTDCGSCKGSGFRVTGRADSLAITGHRFRPHHIGTFATDACGICGEHRIWHQEAPHA